MKSEDFVFIAGADLTLATLAGSSTSLAFAGLKSLLENLVRFLGDYDFKNSLISKFRKYFKA